MATGARCGGKQVIKRDVAGARRACARCRARYAVGDKVTGYAAKERAAAR